MTSAATAPAARSIALDATWCYRNRQMCGVGEACDIWRHPAARFEVALHLVSPGAWTGRRA